MRSEGIPGRPAGFAAGRAERSRGTPMALAGQRTIPAAPGRRSLRATGRPAWRSTPRPSTVLAARPPDSAGRSPAPTDNWSIWPRATVDRSSSTRSPSSATLALSVILPWCGRPTRASLCSCVRASCRAKQRRYSTCRAGHAVGQAASRRPGRRRRGSSPVQQPNIPAQQLATIVRVPLGEPVLLGGMTFAPAGPAGVDKASDDPTQLYVIATTSIAK